MKLFAEKNSIGAKAVCLFVATVVLVVSLFSAVRLTFGRTVNYNISPTRLGTSNTFYSYDYATKTLTISGSGNTPDFINNESSIPWYEWEMGTVDNVVVEDGITKIGNYMFYQMEAKNYSLPLGLKIIGKYAFSFNGGMTSIDIPFGVESIMLNAFASNYYLESITLPDTLRTIGQRAFYNCIALDDVIIPSTVESIGAYAFNKCSSLTSLEFASLTQTMSIGNYAFLECNSLKQMDFSMNAVMGIKCFGFSTTTTKYEDVLMRVFSDSPAHSYAYSNSLPFELLDAVPIREGVDYRNEYNEGNISESYHYTFTPQTSEVFNIYSTGSCDLVGRLYSNGTMISENDDISESNRNFCISATLVKDVTYDLYVSNVKSEGEYSIYVFPDDITGLEVLSGSISADVSDSTIVSGKRIFTFGQDRYSDFILSVSFANGSEHIMMHQPYIAGYYAVSGDDQTQTPYSCGDGVAHISLKGNAAGYPLSIEHSYSMTVVEPTVDDNGYDLYTCVICGDIYTENEVEPSSYIVTGRCVLAENMFDKHDYNIPYSHATIKIGSRTYPVNANGTWQIRTFENCFAIFQNEYGENRTVFINVESNGSYELQSPVVLDGYDLNKDSYVNAKDYVIYRKQLYDELGEGYWRFGSEFLIKHV